MGPWEIHPYINIEETYDDNIYLEDSNEKDDWIITISPGLRINGELREHEFAIEYRAEFLDYSDYKSNDTDKHYFGGSAKFRFPEGWSLNIKENFVKTYDPATSEQTALEDRTRNDVSIILGYDKTENLNFELGYENITDDYKNLSDLDKSENVATLTGYYKLFPKTSILLEYAYGDITYDNPTNSNSTYNQVRAGLKGELFNKLSGTIKFGYQERDYEDSAKKDFDGGVLYSSLIYDVSRRTQLEFNGKVGVTESSYTSNNYYDFYEFGLAAVHELTGKWKISLDMSYGENDYPVETTETITAKREDEIFAQKVGLDYQLNEWVGTKLEYQHKERASNHTAFDYKDNKIIFKIMAVF